MLEMDLVPFRVAVMETAVGRSFARKMGLGTFKGQSVGALVNAQHLQGTLYLQR